LVLLAVTAVAADPEPAPVALKKVPADGQSHHVKGKGATYWVVIPEGLDESKPVRVILWCHGSNMNGRSYTESLKAMEFGKDEILACPNGDSRVREWVYNFTYAPKPALKTLEDLESRFKLGKVFVGGHSQGAYYTFLLVTKFPDRFAGGLPFAGGLLKGCDPKSAAYRKGKPGPAMAILHGEMDPVVSPSLSDWAYEIFFEAEWPCLRYYHPKRLNHMFMPAPVRPALEWLFLVTSEDPQELTAGAGKLLEEERGAEALYCLERAKRFKGDGKEIAALREKVAARAKELAAQWLETIRTDKSGSWWAECYDYRGQWGRVPESAPVLKKLEQLRKKHKSSASKLSRKAWKFDGKGDKEKAREHFIKIVEECFIAFEYTRSADRWLKKNGG
jgi:predicted esterase